MDVALLLIRVVVGLLLAGHGAQKLFGWFGGYGLAGTGGYFESLGYRPGRPFAALGGLGEFGGGLLLAFGFLTPLAAVAAVGVMINAIIAAHWGKGPWVTDQGWELPLTYAVVALGLAFAGAGSYSLDAAIGWDLAGTGWGLTALAAGLVSAGLALSLRSPVVDEAEAEPEVTEPEPEVPAAA